MEHIQELMKVDPVQDCGTQYRAMRKAGLSCALDVFDHFVDGSDCPKGSIMSDDINPYVLQHVYETSAQFTDDLLALKEHMTEAVRILRDVRFGEWIKVTKEGYGSVADGLDEQMDLLTSIVEAGSTCTNLFAAKVFQLDE